MALTLHSSSSFINLKEERTSRTISEPSGIVSYEQIRPQYRIRVKSSVHEAQVSCSPMKNEILYDNGSPHRRDGSRVPVFVMLPLDTMTMEGRLNKPRAMNASLMALKSAGVEGVMVDAWWGLVEKDGPLKYNWEGYVELVNMVQKHGLKLQVVMSFHQCGGNVGDSCSIPLPPWVLEEISKNPEIVYTDRSGRRNPEYISLGCDSLPILKGRTPLQVYSDYMTSFRHYFKEFLGDTIVEIQVGMGPCGELRYPSYPESNGTWRFPGIGEFQCYDKYMKASLEASASSHGRKEWGKCPHDSGQYNEYPQDTSFFKKEGTWNTPYGHFFLEWYSNSLIQHGDNILSQARSIFTGTRTKLSGKIAGVHWHYRTRSHAAESTAGYYNTRQRDGYLPIAKMMSKHGVVLNFTCMEMRDEQQPDHANCSPEGLVKQVKMSTKSVGIELAGENALERYDNGAYQQLLETTRNGLSGFTYLRMNKNLFQQNNWQNFVGFVKSMDKGGQNMRLPESDSIGTELYVGFIKGLNENHKVVEASFV